jgi:hypothetical protein
LTVSNCLNVLAKPFHDAFACKVGYDLTHSKLQGRIFAATFGNPPRQALVTMHLKLILGTSNRLM